MDAGDIGRECFRHSSVRNPIARITPFAQFDEQPTITQPDQHLRRIRTMRTCQFAEGPIIDLPNPACRHKRDLLILRQFRTKGRKPDPIRRRQQVHQS